MVLPILIAIIAAPGLLGTQEAIRQSQAKEKREEHRARRCNLIATCVKSSMRSREINGRPIVLKNGKLYIDTGTSDGGAFGHPYAGYYLPYPDEKYEGLVTTITDEAPIMNWVYVDKDTYEVKYGVRLNAQPNFKGPFDCTRQDRRMTFDGWEGWCAVEEFPTIWSLYFDKDDDGLRSKIAPGTRVLEVELTRKEKRWKKETDARQQDQTTKREVDAKEDTPVDKPVTEQPHLDPPGVVESSLEPIKLPDSIFAPKEPPPQPEPARPKTPPPVDTTDLNTTPPNDQRGGPSKARNPKALAQAQILEALSQRSTPVQPRIGKSPSRPSSTADTASDISEARVNKDVPPAYTERPDSSILTPTAPAPNPRNAPKPQTQTSDPAIFTPSAYTGEASSITSERNRTASNLSISTNTNTPYRTVRKDPSPTRPTVGGPPKMALPRVPLSPGKRRPISPEKTMAVSPDKRRPSSSGKTMTGSLDQRRPVSPEKTRTISPEKRRPISPLKSRTISPEKRRPISPEKSRTISPEKRLPGPLKRSTTDVGLGRGSTTSIQNEDMSRPRAGSSTAPQNNDSPRFTPRPLARAGTTSGRPSMVATMTTGQKGSMHKNMAASQSPSSPGDLPTYEKKNSNLYREIDDILQPEGSNTSTTPAAGSSQGPRKDERPSKLRKSPTSKLPRKSAESPKSPIQRIFSFSRTGSLKKKEGRNAEGRK